MPISFKSGIVEHAGVVDHTGVVKHEGISMGPSVPPPVIPNELYWHFDASVGSSVTTVTGNKISQWDNLSTDGIALSNFINTSETGPTYNISIQNDLPGAQIFSNTERDLLASGTAPQSHTMVIVLRVQTWLNGRLWFESLGASSFYLSTIANDGFTSSAGAALAITETDIGDYRAGFVITIFSDGVNSTINLRNDGFNVSTSGNLGVNPITNLLFGRNFPSSQSPGGCLQELRVYDGELSPTDSESIYQELNDFWFSQYPLSLSGLTGWWVSSESYDVLVTGGNFADFDNKVPPNSDRFLQSVVADRPGIGSINGLRVPDFDGGNEFMESTGFSYTGALLIFLIIEPSLPVSTKTPFTSLNDLHKLTIDVSGSPVFTYTSDGGTNSISVPFSTSATSIIIEVNGASSNIYRNSDSPVSGTLPTTNTLNDPLIGTNFNQTIFTLMKFGEVGILEGTYTTQEINGLVTHLSRWL